MTLLRLRLAPLIRSTITLSKPGGGSEAPMMPGFFMKRSTAGKRQAIRDTAVQSSHREAAERNQLPLSFANRATRAGASTNRD